MKQLNKSMKWVGTFLGSMEETGLGVTWISTSFFSPPWVCMVGWLWMIAFALLFFSVGEITKINN